MGIFSTIRPTVTDPIIISGFPEDMDDWSCNDWTEYYLRLKDSKGRAEAIRIVDLDSGRVGFFANLGWCRFNCSFIDFMKKEGFEVETGLLSGAFCSIKSVTEGVGEIGETTTKTLKFLIPAIGIGALAVGVFFATEQVKKKRKKRK
jgi:hypothetical protein